MKSLKGYIQIDPLPKGRPIYSRKNHTVRTPFKTRIYENELKFHLKQMTVGKKPMDGPLESNLVFFLRRPPSIKKSRKVPSVKPDLDNLCKAFYDAAEKAGVFTNDSRIVKQTHEKYYADGFMPKIQFHIRNIETD